MTQRNIIIIGAVVLAVLVVLVYLMGVETWEPATETPRIPTAPSNL